MTDILLVKLLHLVGFAYWLGGDLGVFTSSYIVANDKLSPEVRISAAKLLFALDQAPRICMTLMLPLGTHLAWRLGALPIDAGAMIAIWLLAIGWLTMVITLHVAPPSRGKTLLTTFDFWFRLVLALGLAAVGINALLHDGSPVPYWVAAKLLIFGALIGCGLIIRIRLKPFGPAFAELAQGNATDAVNATIRCSLNGTRPFVVAIWIGLLASAALGIHLI